MKRCIDSGMWVPDAADLEKVTGERAPAGDAPPTGDAPGTGDVPSTGAAPSTGDAPAESEEDIYEDASSSPTKS